jgi:hypothetical protein
MPCSHFATVSPRNGIAGRPAPLKRLQPSGLSDHAYRTKAGMGPWGWLTSTVSPSSLASAQFDSHGNATLGKGFRHAGLRPAQQGPARGLVGVALGKAVVDELLDQKGEICLSPWRSPVADHEARAVHGSPKSG